MLHWKLPKLSNMKIDRKQKEGSTVQQNMWHQSTQMKVEMVKNNFDK